MTVQMNFFNQGDRFLFQTYNLYIYGNYGSRPIMNIETTTLCLIMRSLLRLMCVLVMSCFTHMLSFGLLWTAAYILRLQWLYHWSVICSGRVCWGWGESLLPFCLTQHVAASLQKRALQFVDVGLVLGHLCWGLRVLEWSVNHDTGRWGRGQRGGSDGHDLYTLL